MIIIPELGLVSLIVAFCMACLLAGYPFLKIERGAILLLWGKIAFVLLGFFTLILCFIQNNFSVEYVALNSNTKLPWIYKISAVWGAHEGSLLLWIVILSAWMIPLIFLRQERVIAVASAINAGFLFLLLHTSNPFLRLLPMSPIEGNDLNPLLQDPGFLIHPPFLYMGYVGFAIPFAFSMVALIDRDHSDKWVRGARPFALIAWGCLTIGIVLGSWWAYYELGWGGWWFWDPVENASLMPWLLGGALCHALMVSARCKTYIGWSHLLAILTFLLSVLGTFLVRSGSISSVHAFASDPKRGVYILSGMLILSVLSIGLYFRREAPPPGSSISSGWSRESFIVLGNVVLMVMMVTVLLGTLYPLAMEVMGGQSLSVGSPYFSTLFTPLMVILLLLMYVAPYLQWEHDQWERLKGYSKKLILFGIGVGGLTYLGGLVAGGMLLGLGLVVLTLLKKNATLGMRLAHMGLGIFIIGVVGVNTWEKAMEISLAVGESIQQGGTTFLFQSVDAYAGSNYEGRRGHFVVKEGKKWQWDLFPEKRYFPTREWVMTETAIRPGILKDYYIALGEHFEDGRWSVRIQTKPLIRWVWLGGLLIACGALCAGYESYKRVRRYEAN